MQKLVTEVRRFRSDQGLADRQKVPARLTEVASADLDSQIPAVTSLAWLTPASDGFAPTASVEVRLTRGTVVVELDTSGTVDVAAERRRLEKDLAAAEKELKGTTAKLDNEAFWRRRPPMSSTRFAPGKLSPARKSKESRPGWHLCNDRPCPDAGRNRLATPSRAPPRPEVAGDQARTEHGPHLCVDGTARPAAARLSVDPHRGHQRQDVGRPYGRCAVDRVAPTVRAARPALTCNRPWSGSRSTTSRSRPLSTSPPTKRSNRSSNWSTSSPPRAARDEQVRGGDRDGVRGLR